jgi:hypothetical protein
MQGHTNTNFLKTFRVRRMISSDEKYQAVGAVRRLNFHLPNFKNFREFFAVSTDSIHAKASPPCGLTVKHSLFVVKK